MDDTQKRQIESAINFKNPITGESAYDLLRHIGEQIMHLRIDVEEIYDHLTGGEYVRDEPANDDAPLVLVPKEIRTGMGSQKSAISGKILASCGIDDTEKNRMAVGYALRREMREAIKIMDQIGSHFRGSICAAVVMINLGAKDKGTAMSTVKSIMLSEEMRERLRRISKSVGARDVIEMTMIYCPFDVVKGIVSEIVANGNP